MTISADVTDLAAGYEALRAQALGELPATTPRGLAVFVRGGLVAWMRALAPITRPTQPPVRSEAREPTGFGTELVALLAEMVLSSGKRCFT
ncbi:MAG: hypothetical protein ACRDZ5_08185 [Acidimicrobiales bacterium]